VPFIPGVKGAKVFRAAYTVSQSEKIIAKAITKIDKIKNLIKYFDELPTTTLDIIKKYKNDMANILYKKFNMSKQRIIKIIDSVHYIFDTNKELLKYAIYSLAKITGSIDQKILSEINEQLDRAANSKQ